MSGGAGDEPVARRLDLLVAGDLNPDVVLAGVPAELGVGQRERLVSNAVLTVGGSAGIVACGAARLGLSTAFASIVGDDDAGRYVLNELAARQVDVGGVVVQNDLPTGLSVALVRTARDDRAILTAPGCIPLFEAAMIDRTLLRSARHLHVTSYFLQPKLAAGLQGLFAEARAAGLSTSLDCNDDPSSEWDDGLLAILPAVDLLFANRHEALAMTHRSGDLEPSLAQLASPQFIDTQAGGTRVYFEPAQATANPSERLTVSLFIDGAADVASAPMQIQFDPKFLRLNDVSLGGYLSQGGQQPVFTKNIQNDTGVAVVQLHRPRGARGVNGAGTQVTLPLLPPLLLILPMAPA